MSVQNVDLKKIKRILINVKNLIKRQKGGVREEYLILLLWGEPMLVHFVRR